MIIDINKCNLNEDYFHFTNRKNIESILNNGLYIPCKCVGIKSTVFFPNKINLDTFNYLHLKNFNNNMDKIYVIIVAIPKNIYLNGKKYSLGDKLEYIDVASYSLFSSLLPKEFIYGYYVKNITYKKDIVNDKYIVNNIVFDEGLEFYQNDCFYKFMSNKEQEEFWINYFKENNLDISLLFSDNNFSKFDLVNRMIRKRRKC